MPPIEQTKEQMLEALIANELPISRKIAAFCSSTANVDKSKTTLYKESVLGLELYLNYLIESGEFEGLTFTSARAAVITTLIFSSMDRPTIMNSKAYLSLLEKTAPKEAEAIKKELAPPTDEITGIPTEEDISTLASAFNVRTFLYSLDKLKMTAGTNIPYDQKRYQDIHAYKENFTAYAKLDAVSKARCLNLLVSNLDVNQVRAYYIATALEVGEEVRLRHAEFSSYFGFNTRGHEKAFRRMPFLTNHENNEYYDMLKLWLPLLTDIVALYPAPEVSVVKEINMTPESRDANQARMTPSKRELFMSYVCTTGSQELSRVNGSYYKYRTADGQEVEVDSFDISALFTVNSRTGASSFVEENHPHLIVYDRTEECYKYVSQTDGTTTTITYDRVPVKRGQEARFLKSHYTGRYNEDHKYTIVVDGLHYTSDGKELSIVSGRCFSYKDDHIENGVVPVSLYTQLLKNIYRACVKSATFGNVTAQELNAFCAIPNQVKYKANTADTSMSAPKIGNIIKAMVHAGEIIAAGSELGPLALTDGVVLTLTDRSTGPAVTGESLETKGAVVDVSRQNSNAVVVWTEASVREIIPCARNVNSVTGHAETICRWIHHNERHISDFVALAHVYAGGFSNRLTPDMNSEQKRKALEDPKETLKYIKGEFSKCSFSDETILFLKKTNNEDLLKRLEFPGRAQLVRDLQKIDRGIKEGVDETCDTLIAEKLSPSISIRDEINWFNVYKSTKFKAAARDILKLYYDGTELDSMVEAKTDKFQQLRKDELFKKPFFPLYACMLADILHYSDPTIYAEFIAISDKDKYAWIGEKIQASNNQELKNAYISPDDLGTLDFTEFERRFDTLVADTPGYSNSKLESFKGYMNLWSLDRNAPGTDLKVSTLVSASKYSQDSTRAQAEAEAARIAEVQEKRQRTLDTIGLKEDILSNINYIFPPLQRNWSDHALTVMKLFDPDIYYTKMKDLNYIAGKDPETIVAYKIIFLEMCMLNGIEIGDDNKTFLHENRFRLLTKAGMPEGCRFAIYEDDVYRATQDTKLLYTTPVFEYVYGQCITNSRLALAAIESRIEKWKELCGVATRLRLTPEQVVLGLCKKTKDERRQSGGLRGYLRSVSANDQTKLDEEVSSAVDHGQPTVQDGPGEVSSVVDHGQSTSTTTSAVQDGSGNVSRRRTRVRSEDTNPTVDIPPNTDDDNVVTPPQTWGQWLRNCCRRADSRHK